MNFTRLLEWKMEALFQRHVPLMDFIYLLRDFAWQDVIIKLQKFPRFQTVSS